MTDIISHIRSLIKDSGLKDGSAILLSKVVFDAYMLKTMNNLSLDGFHIIGMDIEGQWVVCDHGETGGTIYDTGKGVKYPSNLQEFANWWNDRKQETLVIRKTREVNRANFVKSFAANELKDG